MASSLVSFFKHFDCEQHLSMEPINELFSDTKCCMWHQLSCGRGGQMGWVIIESGAWIVMLLSKKSCTLTNGYNFWPNGKCSILKIGMRAKVMSSIPDGQLLRDRLLRVAQLSLVKVKYALRSQIPIFPHDNVSWSIDIIWYH